MSSELPAELKPDKTTLEERFTSEFKRWDRKGDGIISREELTKVLKSINTDFSDTEIEAVMDAADTKKDGTINYIEFAKWVFGATPEKEEHKKAQNDARALFSEEYSMLYSEYWLDFRGSHFP